MRFHDIPALLELQDNIKKISKSAYFGLVSSLGTFRRFYRIFFSGTEHLVNNIARALDSFNP